MARPVSVQGSDLCCQAVLSNPPPRLSSPPGSVAPSLPVILLSPTFLMKATERKELQICLLKGTETDLRGLITSPSRREIVLLT